MRVVKIILVYVFGRVRPLRKFLVPVDSGRMKTSKPEGTVVPAAVQGGDPVAGGSMGCLPQRPWGVYLLASVLSPEVTLTDFLCTILTNFYLQ
jgi:hypothetical protein